MASATVAEDSAVTCVTSMRVCPKRCLEPLDPGEQLCGCTSSKVPDTFSDRRSIAHRPHLLEQEHALLVRDHDVRQLVAVHVLNNKLRADARVVVDLVRYELDDTVLAAPGLEPVQHGGIIRGNIAVRSVGPPAFASDQVLEAVAVDVHVMERMALRKQLGK